MSDQSRIYFSARANAHALLAGGPAASVRARMVHGALLYDHVVVDDGMWDGRSGPTGSWEVRMPLGTYEGTAELQTPRDRGKAKGSNFYVAAKPSESIAPAHRMISLTTTIGWRATFEPLKRSLPHAYPWLTFGPFDLFPDDKKTVSKMVAQDEGDGVLRGLIPDEFPRKLVIASANFALVLGSRMDATVSLDAMHTRALAARMARGQASSVLGGGALAVVFPSAAALSWEEVDDARNHPGMKSLRARLAEIEAAALEASGGGRAIEVATMQAYADALHRDIERLKPSFRGAVAAVTIGAVISIVTGPLPLVVGVGAGAMEVVAETALARRRHDRSWVAAADRLRPPRDTPPSKPT
jgi:hypothetical protein